MTTLSQTQFCTDFCFPPKAFNPNLSPCQNFSVPRNSPLQKQALAFAQHPTSNKTSFKPFQSIPTIIIHPSLYRYQPNPFLHQPIIILSHLCDLKPQQYFMLLSVQIINKAKHGINHSNQRQLDLRSKNIAELGSLTATMNYFQSIDLSNNLLKALNNLSYLDRLKSLMLANNKISIIYNIGQSFPNLQNLFLMNNRVKEMEQVKNLSGCRHLSTLVLNNNPICDMLTYRVCVIGAIQSLKLLDFKKIATKEREEANAKVNQ